MRHEDSPRKLSVRSGKIATGTGLGVLLASVAAAFALCAGTASESKASPAAATTPAEAPPAAKVTGKNFTLDFSASDCKAGSECTATLKLEAQGEFHINDNYPYKFKAADAAGVEFLGKDSGGKNVFSKQAGNFKKDAEKVATMTVLFKPAKAGSVTLSGQYKMSVCSAQNCQLETQEISTNVTVK